MIRIDMDMPENCAECRFADSDYSYCSAMPKEFCGYTEEKRKPEWCPLHSIDEPPEPRILTLEEAKNLHGDIIWIDHREPYQTPEEWLEMLVYCVDGVEVQKMYTDMEPMEVFVYHVGVDEVEEYGKSFVFWNGRPTKEQREAEKWNESLSCL